LQRCLQTIPDLLILHLERSEYIGAVRVKQCHSIVFAEMIDLSVCVFQRRLQTDWGYKPFGIGYPWTLPRILSD
jgi:hypothetical protein